MTRRLTTISSYDKSQEGSRLRTYQEEARQTSDGVDANLFDSTAFIFTQVQPMLPPNPPLLRSMNGPLLNQLTPLILPPRLVADLQLREGARILLRLRRVQGEQPSTRSEESAPDRECAESGLNDFRR